MAESTSSDSEDETVTDGAVKGGNGRYVFELENLDGVHAGGNYSSAFGGLVEGERHQAGLMRLEVGDGADPHKHPNEQFVFILEGKVKARVGDQESEVSEGELIYIPPDTVHAVEILSDNDVIFFTTKDLSHGIVGTAVDE